MTATRWGSQRTATAAWRKLRHQILERDGHRCTKLDDGRRCTDTATDVHHITEHADGGTDDPSNLTSLCAWHHRKITGKYAASRRSSMFRPEEPHPGLLP